MRASFSIDSSQWPDLWQAAYRILEQTIVPSQLLAWIQPLQFDKAEAADNGLKVHFNAPNDFTAQWVRDHYQTAIQSAFSQVTGSPCDVVLTAHQAAGANLLFQPPVEAVSPPQVSVSTPPIQAIQATNTRTSAPNEPGLDPKYTFNSFVVGSSNQFAHASAVAVSEQPGRQYNPLFIYSSPGLGKTHLLHAIGNHFLSKNPGARVAYLSAEKFVNELIESLQHNRMSQFRTKYRDSYDMILIDDIQFIAGKVRTEEEFFHTFNALHATKRQIVVTSDRPPKEIQGLEERIRTRFEWGLIADVHPPEIETRIAILKTKAERDDIYLPDDVATFLATHIKSNVRELEGVLIRLQAQASLTGAELSLEMAKHELKTVLPEEGSQITVESILNAVAKHFNVKLPEFKSNTRARQIAQPRQIAMYLIRKYTGMGFKEIGQYFGGRDHTTVLHACKKIEESFENDSSLHLDVEAIQNLL